MSNPNNIIHCLDIGYVKLIDVFPSQNAETRIAQCARTSFDNFNLNKTPEEDKALVKYLVENYHTSPLEMVEFLFEIYCPQFVATHLHRHRTSSINEQSQRYVEIMDDMYHPSTDIRKQSKSNKQGSEEDQAFHEALTDSVIKAEKLVEEQLLPAYHDLVKKGVAKEIARAFLPRAMYTKMVYKMDANNLLKFLRLRCALDAQKETRVYAMAMKELVKSHIPTLVEWLDDSLNSLTLRPDELEHINNGTCPTTLRRKKEFLDKCNRLFPKTIMVLLFDDGTIKDIVLKGSDIRDTFANVPFILPRLHNPSHMSYKDNLNVPHDVIITDINSIDQLEELKNKYSSSIVTVKWYKNLNYQSDLMSYKADYLIAHMEDYPNALTDYY